MTGENLSEPHIIVNGVTLTSAQALTLRRALESFATDMAQPDAMGADEHGRKMAELYRARIHEIRAAMYVVPPDPCVAVYSTKARP